MTVVLRAQQQALAANGVIIPRATNARHAMNLAYQFEQHLPLNAQQFGPLDFRAYFSAQDALAVTAEKVLRVPDTNRRGAPCRIDFFAYMPSGEVRRYHPDTGQPHTMAWRCNLFDVSTACSRGVGAALHQKPPGALQHGGSQPRPLAAPFPLLATPQDLRQVQMYDIQMLNWRAVEEALGAVDDQNHTVDWSDGEHFPWWVWLANTGKLSRVVNTGIWRVEVQVAHGNKQVVVHSVGGVYRLSVQNNKRIINGP